jgi:hypothetical protein
MENATFVLKVRNMSFVLGLSFVTNVVPLLQHHSLSHYLAIDQAIDSAAIPTDLYPFSTAYLYHYGHLYSMWNNSHLDCDLHLCTCQRLLELYDEALRKVCQPGRVSNTTLPS